MPAGRLNEAAASPVRTASGLGGWDTHAYDEQLGTAGEFTLVRQRTESPARGRPRRGSRGNGEQRPLREDAGPGTGHVLIWPGQAIYFGPLLENEAHAHHAIQISMALEDTLSLQAPPDLRWRAYRGVATAPDQPHRIRCRGPVAHIYLDPDGEAGLALRGQMGNDGVHALHGHELEPVAAALRASATGEPDPARLAAIIDNMVRTATPLTSREPMDPRVKEALDIVHALPERRVSLVTLAHRVALSPSRLGTLFRRDTGIPLRRYLLWLRLIDAVAALSDGRSLTEAAHDAGFSDSAHLSRTFRRMFGMPPSALRSKGVEIQRLPKDSALADTSR